MNELPVQIYLIPNIIAPDTQGLVIPPGAIDVIKTLDYFLVENVRSARRFIASLKIRNVSELDFQLFDKRSHQSDLEQLLEPLSRGASIGVISEAGCPSIADPGNKIALWGHQHGIKVTPLTGPSSILLGLMASGLNGQHFEFHGYLPIDQSSRERAIRLLEKESSKSGKTQIFMETPYRNTALLEALIRHCQPDTYICIACGLTGPDEFIKTYRVKNWKHRLPDVHKKPTVFYMHSNAGDI
jgi:16S rRNA (cytidine1402-2'-O)-methyltransferase